MREQLYYFRVAWKEVWFRIAETFFLIRPAKHMLAWAREREAKEQKL